MNEEQVRMTRDHAQLDRYRGWLFSVFVACVLVLAAAMAAAVLRWDQLTAEDGDIRASVEAARSWDGALTDTVSRLDALARVAASTEGVVTAFTEGRRPTLLGSVSPWFQSLRAGRHLTSLTFIGPDHRVVLRLHDPGRWGDVVDLSSLREAAQARHTVSTFHVAASGAQLELTAPLVQSGRIIGFLSLGQDLSNIVSAMAESRKLESVLLLRKDLPEFATVGQTSGWDRYPDVFVAAESHPGVAGALAETPSGDALKTAKGNARVVQLPLTDGTGRPIGRLDVIGDDGTSYARLHERTAVFLVAVATLAALGLGAGWLLLFRLRPALGLSDRERRNLEHASQRDGLTGLFNRSTFDETVHKEITHAHAVNLPLSVMLIELVEPTEGAPPSSPEMEEAVLLGVAATLQRQLRLGDLAARYDERRFALILQGVGGLLARDVAERLRRAVVSTRIDGDDGLIALRACVGVSSFPEAGNTGAAALIHEAEKALAVARARGPNHTCVSGVDLPPGVAA